MFLVQFQTFWNLYPPKKQKNMCKFEKFWKKKSGEKIFWLRYRYWNWTLVLVPDTETWFWSHTNPRPFEEEGFTYIPEKIGVGGYRPPYPPHFRRPCYFTLADSLSIWFFFFCNSEVQFWRKRLYLSKNLYCPAHHMFSRKTNYELSPIFYGQETNYVFLLNLLLC
jgi:hypothetical protein